MRAGRSRLSPGLLSVAMAAAGLAVLPAGSPAAAAQANLVRNPGFESGDLRDWSCAPGSATVTSPVRSGEYALAATPTGSSPARCEQTVGVQPGETYSLSAWVRGSYVYLGVSGTGTQDTSAWLPSASGWAELSVGFDTGPSTSRVTIYLHSWYGQPTYHADDVELAGPGGDDGDVPAAPLGPTVTGTTSSSVSLSWTAPAGVVDGYHVYRDGTRAATTSETSATVSGLAAATGYAFTVTAFNSAGESPHSTEVRARTDDGPPPGGGLPPHVLVGYLHASFANGSGYVSMRNVPDEWDIINLAFAEPTSPSSGQVEFELCPPSECPGVESEAELIAAIRDKRAAGKKVLISIGGANGQVQLTSTGARDAFVRSVSAIIDRYGLDGLDIDFEGHSLFLNSGDTDFRNPTTPVIVNLIAALRTLKSRYGPDFVLTMAPETFFVQLGYQFYGSGANGTADPRAGAYLPVIHAMRDDLTLLHVQDYNSGPIMGLDDQYHFMGSADFHIAMTDMLLTGFPVERDPQRFFPALSQGQVAIGLPASVNAGNGFTSVAEVHQALDCLMKGQRCGGYQTDGVFPDMRGLMAWSINWDRFNGFEFSRDHRAYFDALP